LTSLLDVNVLLALAWAQHEHHDAAHVWFRAAALDGWATCLLTQTAFLRLSMNPHVVHVSIDCRTARDLQAGLTAHPNHQFIAESPPLTDALFEPLVPLVAGYRQMTDATLLWLARAHGLELVSFDQSLKTLTPWPDDLNILPV
jgi:uncharacterized protein